MKTKLLFLGKLLGISLLLFVFIGWIEKGYQLILLFICSLLSLLLSSHQRSVVLDYTSYLHIIPFLALMLATPRIKLARRAVIILFGLAVFIGIDIASILVWGGFPGRNSTVAHVIFSQIWKTTGQWILPPLFWFIAVHKDMGELFADDGKAVLPVASSTSPDN
jgi:hypothetical protein